MNGYRIYVDIMKGKKILSNMVANMLVYWSVRLSSRKGCGKGGIVILARCLFHFFREHENLE